MFKQKSFLAVVILFCFSLSSIVSVSPYLMATTTSEIYISCSVASFGGYKLKGEVNSIIARPGLNRIGKITVDGGCNEPYPWILLIYTDNRNYQPVAGSIYQGKPPSGLVRDGGGSMALKFQTKNTGDDWIYVPDINDKNRVSYFAVRNLKQVEVVEDAEQSNEEKDNDPPRDVVVAGIDPRNADWVAGSDKILYTDDDNFYGDITMPAPFDIDLAVQVPSADTSESKSDPNGRLAPYGKYSSKIVLEIISEP